MTAVDLVDRLEDRLATTGPVRTDDLEKALLDVLDGPAFAEWLDQLAADRDAVARLAAVSCWHPNGFAKLVLHRGDGCALRLHVWPDDRPQTGDTEPHSHRWDFASTVLAGSLTVLEYVETDDETGLRYTRCSYDGSHVRREAETRLAQCETFLVPQGFRYRTDRSVVHKVHPVPGTLVATLLVQGPHMSDVTAVYRLGPGLDPARAIDEATVRELLLAVRGHVG